MTRVNLISPQRLTDRHLVAEYKELSQLVGQVRNMVRSDVWSRIPETFAFGKGSVTFFVDKLGYICARWARIKREMKRRGFHPVSTLNLEGLPNRCFGDWVPTEEAKRLVKERIQMRINQKPELYPDAEARGWKVKGGRDG